MASLLPCHALAQADAPRDATASQGERAGGSGTREPDAAEVELARGTLDDAMPMDAVLRTVLGTATKPVVFDWRNAEALLQFDLGQLVEYNNFESRRVSGGARFPGVAGTVSTTLSYVDTNGTAATETIARTPYLQTGRPSRWELGLGYDYAFAEGVATWLPSFMPDAQVVFSLTGELRYLFYPSAWAKNKGGKRFSSLFKLEIGGTEVGELDRTKPAGMKIDPTRVDMLVGGRFDVYFTSGFFLSPASLLALPLLRSGEGLTTFWNVSLGVGYAIL